MKNFYKALKETAEHFNIDRRNSIYEMLANYNLPTNLKRILDNVWIAQDKNYDRIYRDSFYLCNNRIIDGLYEVNYLLKKLGLVEKVDFHHCMVEGTIKRTQVLFLDPSHKKLGIVKLNNDVARKIKNERIKIQKTSYEKNIKKCLTFQRFIALLKDGNAYKKGNFDNIVNFGFQIDYADKDTKALNNQILLGRTVSNNKYMLSAISTNAKKAMALYKENPAAKNLMHKQKTIRIAAKYRAKVTLQRGVHWIADTPKIKNIDIIICDRETTDYLSESVFKVFGNISKKDLQQHFKNDCSNFVSLKIIK